MKKKFAVVLPMILFTLIFVPSAWSGKDLVKIGINALITGDIPKIGEGTKFTAQMWLADIEAAGGLNVGAKMYQVELVTEDNESRAESAVKVNTRMITEDEVLVIVGPQASKQAVPAGDVANNYKTPMISPWSTNPDTTKDRPYVFRGCFLDPFQGPMLANFITEECGRGSILGAALAGFLLGFIGDLRSDDLPIDSARPDRLLNHPAHPDLQAPRLLWRTV